MSQSELFIRDAELARMETEHAEILAALRTELAALSRTTDRPVSADDARRLLDRWEIAPGNWLGATFKAGFRAVGWKASETEGRHGSMIREWRPK